MNSLIFIIVLVWGALGFAKPSVNLDEIIRDSDLVVVELLALENLTCTRLDEWGGCEFYLAVGLDSLAPNSKHKILERAETLSVEPRKLYLNGDALNQMRAPYGDLAGDTVQWPEGEPALRVPPKSAVVYLTGRQLKRALLSDPGVVRGVRIAVHEDQPNMIIYSDAQADSNFIELNLSFLELVGGPTILKADFEPKKGWGAGDVQFSAVVTVRFEKDSDRAREINHEIEQEYIEQERRIKRLPYPRGL